MAKLQKIIDKAKEACETSGNPVDDHFADINKMVPLREWLYRSPKELYWIW